LRLESPVSEKTPTVRRNRRNTAGAPFDRRTLILSAAIHGTVAGLFLWLAPPGTPAPLLRQLFVSAESRPALEADPEPFDAKPPELEKPLESPLLEEALPEEAPDPRLAAVPDPLPGPAGGSDAGRWSPDPGIIGLGSGRSHPGRRGRRGAVDEQPARPPEAEEFMIHVPESPPAVEPPPVDEPARLVDYSPPPYPEQARARGLEGVVRLRVEVLADGTIGGIEVLESSGSEVLDRAAVEAVRKWGFRPAVAADRPVRSLLTLPKVRFSLR
jgi:protein TonB